MEILSQIQVRMSGSFSFISFFSLRSSGRQEGGKQRKKSGGMEERGQMKEREKAAQELLCAEVKGGDRAGKVVRR